MQDEWIERLLRCLLGQTIGIENIEIIFIVDASPDDTFARLKDYEEQYPDTMLLINSEEKLGPGGARSLGITYSSGEYIAFLDQDDWVEPCMYAHMYEKAKAYDCDMVESHNTRDTIYQYNEGEPRKTGKEDLFVCINTPEDRRRYFATNHPEKRKYWAKLYRRKMLIDHHIEFPARLRYDDNYFKGLSFYYAKRIYVLEEYLYHWMVNNNSISMQNDFDAHLDRMRVELLKLLEYQKRGLLDSYHDEIEYIFLEQFFANTFNTIVTRNGTLPLEILDYMKVETIKWFPNYQKNPYIQSKYPAWAFGEWIVNATKAITQVTKKEIKISKDILHKLAPYSILDLLSVDFSQEELNWYCSIYVAFDKVAKHVDYKKIREDI